MIDGGGDEEPTPSNVPDLRPKNPLRRPLTKTVKELAVLIGAAATIFGYVAGAGKLLIRWAGIATTTDIQAANMPLLKRMDIRDELDAKDKAAMTAKLDAIKASADTTSAAVARIEKRRRAPSQPRTGKDVE